MTIDPEPVRKFVRLRAQIDDLEDQVAELKRQRDNLADCISASFIDAGVSGLPITVDGESFSVHIVRPLAVYKRAGIETAQLAEVLASIGMEDIVKASVSQQSLQSRVREMLANDEQVPEALANILDIQEKTELRAVRSAKADTLSSKAARNLQ
jgi:preprotein translocase subunit SecD